jgi:hypothetical protein
LSIAIRSHNTTKKKLWDFATCGLLSSHKNRRTALIASRNRNGETEIFSSNPYLQQWKQSKFSKMKELRIEYGDILANSRIGEEYDLKTGRRRRFTNDVTNIIIAWIIANNDFRMRLQPC